MSFFIVSQCNYVKDMWDMLEATHERINDVKRARKHALIQKYEDFRMKYGKSIVDVQNKFTHIVNHLISLGKAFDKEELIIKVLKCIDRSWQMEVIAISKSKDLSIMTTNSLFIKINENEIEINRLNEQKIHEKKMKSLALKVLLIKE